MDDIFAKVVELARIKRPKLKDLSVDVVAATLFVAYRPQARQRVKRLTHFGLIVMLPEFDHVDIKLHQIYNIRGREMLYLDKNSSMPYYVSHRRMVFFDTNLGFMVRLVDGKISDLINPMLGNTPKRI